MGGAPEGCASFGRAAYGGVKYSAWCEAPPKIGGCSRCARPAGTLAAEKYVLAGGAGQNMIASFSAGCGRRNSARRALPGESVGRKGIGYPAGKLPPPQSLPLGGRTVRGTVRSGPGEATINHRWAGEAGSDEGTIWYPTFPCKKKALSQLSPQRGFSIAPLGNPIAPLSVTFGDSFPPRGSLWVV